MGSDRWIHVISPTEKWHFHYTAGDEVRMVSTVRQLALVGGSFTRQDADIVARSVGLAIRWPPPEAPSSKR